MREFFKTLGQSMMSEVSPHLAVQKLNHQNYDREVFRNLHTQHQQRLKNSLLGFKKNTRSKLV